MSRLPGYPFGGRFLPAACIFLWMGGILLASSWPESKLPSVAQFAPWAVAAHLLMYAGLGFLLGWFISNLRRASWPPIAALIVAFILAIAYGALVEVYQGIIPSRDPSWQDGILNAVGAGLGVVGYHFWIAARGRQRNWGLGLADEIVIRLVRRLNPSRAGRGTRIKRRSFNRRT